MEWFNGQVKTIISGAMKHWVCPREGCNGFMISNGTYWATANKGYFHRCDNCGDCWALSRMCYPVAVDLDKKDEILCEIVRWHYYDNARGEHGNVPERNGMDDKLVDKISTVIEPWRFDRAKCEGLAWAKYELESKDHFVDYEKVPQGFLMKFYNSII